MRSLNENQIQEFNEHWDQVIEELNGKTRKVEADLLEQHSAERAIFEEEMGRQEPPPPKHSSELLDLRFRLEQLLKNRKYAAAKALKGRIELMEEAEREEWARRAALHREKQKELLERKQRNKTEALKTRLEKLINGKLKNRGNEYGKLLQRIQNLQNELMTKQSMHLTRISNASSKLLAKYASGRSDWLGIVDGRVIRVLLAGPAGRRLPLALRQRPEAQRQGPDAHRLRHGTALRGRQDAHGSVIRVSRTKRRTPGRTGLWAARPPAGPRARRAALCPWRC